MKLSLKSAIDKKKELTHDLKRLNDIMQTHNNNETSTVYNMQDLLAKVKIGNENLDALKLLILVANVDGSMYEKIYRLRSLTTERGNLIALKHRVTTTAKMSETEIDQEIDLLNTGIRTLQGELDAFNLKTIIEYSPK